MAGCGTLRTRVAVGSSVAGRCPECWLCGSSIPGAAWPPACLRRWLPPGCSAPATEAGVGPRFRAKSPATGKRPGWPRPSKRFWPTRQAVWLFCTRGCSAPAMCPGLGFVVCGPSPTMDRARCGLPVPVGCWPEAPTRAGPGRWFHLAAWAPWPPRWIFLPWPLAVPSSGWLALPAPWCSIRPTVVAPGSFGPQASRCRFTP